MIQAALMQYFRTRSPEDFTAMVNASRELVLAKAHQVVRDHDVAFDISQDVYVHLHTATLQAHEVEKPVGYLINLVIGFARTRQRSDIRRRAREDLKAYVASRGSEIPTFGLDDKLDINEAINKLPPVESQVVHLRHILDLSVKEVASRLAVDPRTVYNREKRAKAMLCSRLSPVVAAAILPGLASPGDATLSTLAASRRLATKLGLPTRRPAHIAACLAATILLGTTVVALRRSQGGPRADIPEVALDTPAVAVMTAETVVAPAPALALTPAPVPAPTARARKPRSLATAGTQPVIARALAPPAARVTLHVVDEAGEPVRAGTVDFQPAPASGWQRGLQQAASAVGLGASISQRALAASNPLTVDLPPALQGVTVKVHVAAPDFVGHRPASFAVGPGGEKKLTVTLLSAIAVTLHVRNARTGEPVEGALVKVNDDAALLPKEFADIDRLLGTPRKLAGKTSAAGTLILPDVRLRTLGLSIVAAGYSAVDADDVPVADVPVDEVVTLWLHEQSAVPAMGSLTVRILDPHGRPWPRCEFRLESDLVAATGAASRLTDQAGECRIEDVAAGLHVVELVQSRPELTEEALELARQLLFYRPCPIHVEAGKEAEVILKSSERSGRARVTVVNPAGRPCPQVALRLGWVAGPRATTDEHGEAVFLDLEAGKHEIETLARGVSVKLGEVDVVPRSEVRARVTLGAGRIVGRVLDEDGRPVRGRIGGESPVELLATLDDEGRFEIHGLVAKTYRLVILPGDSLLVPATVAVLVPERGVAKDLEVRLRRGGPVTLLVESPDGGPARGVSVGRKVSPERAESVREIHRGRREAEFRSEFALEPGEQVFLVHSPNQAAQEVRVQVKPGEETVVRVTVEEAMAAVVPEVREAVGQERPAER